MRVGDIVVEKPKLYYNHYEFYRIKKQTPKMVLLERLEYEYNLHFPLTGPARCVTEYTKVTNEVIDSHRVNKENLFSDYEVYDPNKTYKTVIYDD